MAVDAVVFDWGGTLTAWHDIDFHAESLALAQAVLTTPDTSDDHHAHAARLHEAGSVVWGRSRDHQQSATIGDLFDAVADKAVPTVLWPVWILARPAVRSLVVSLAAGAVEQVLQLVRR